MINSNKGTLTSVLTILLVLQNDIGDLPFPALAADYPPPCPSQYLIIRYLSCSTWTRTRDQRINSPSLYQLSYGTIIKSVVSSEPHTSEVVCGQNKRATPTKQAKPPWLPHEKSTRHTYKTWHTCNNIFKHYSAITNHLLWSDRFNVLSVLGFSPKR